MKKLAFLATAAFVLTLVPAAHAQAAVTATGDLCDIESWTDDQVVFDGGPIAVTATPANPAPQPDTTPRVLDELPVDGVTDPVSITLTCSIQSGAAHATTDLVSASGSGPNVAVVQPAQATVSPEDWELHLCTQLTVTDADGDVRTVYWDDVDDRFSAD